MPSVLTWSTEEDNLLKSLIAEHGTKKWSLIASLMKTKTGKQCRRRWKNVMSMDAKATTWTEAEDERLIKYHRQVGNRWTEISRRFGDRTDNAVKNRWHALCRKQPDLAEDQSPITTVGVRRGTRTRGLGADGSSGEFDTSGELPCSKRRRGGGDCASGASFGTANGASGPMLLNMPGNWQLPAAMGRHMGGLLPPTPFDHGAHHHPMSMSKGALGVGQEDHIMLQQMQRMGVPMNIDLANANGPSAAGGVDANGAHPLTSLGSAPKFGGLPDFGMDLLSNGGQSLPFPSMRLGQSGSSSGPFGKGGSGSGSGGLLDIMPPTAESMAAWNGNKAFMDLLNWINTSGSSGALNPPLASAQQAQQAQQARPQDHPAQEQHQEQQRRPKRQQTQEEARAAQAMPPPMMVPPPAGARATNHDTNVNSLPFVNSGSFNLSSSGGLSSEQRDLLSMLLSRISSGSLDLGDGVLDDNGNGSGNPLAAANDTVINNSNSSGKESLPILGQGGRGSNVNLLDASGLEWRNPGTDANGGGSTPSGSLLMPGTGTTLGFGPSGSFIERQLSFLRSNSHSEKGDPMNRTSSGSKSLSISSGGRRAVEAAAAAAIAAVDAAVAAVADAQTKMNAEGK